MYIAIQEIFPDMIYIPTVKKIEKETKKCFFDKYGHRFLKSELETGRAANKCFVVFAIGDTRQEAQNNAFAKVEEHIDKMVDIYKKYAAKAIQS